MLNSFCLSADVNSGLKIYPNIAPSKQEWITWIEGNCLDENFNPLDSNEILKRFKKHGKNFLKTLKGHFCLIIANNQTQEILFANDFIGSYEIFYTAEHGKNKFLVGNSLQIIKNLQPSLTISTQAIYEYFYFHMIPSPNTVFEGIKRLSARQYGHYINGKLCIGEYQDIKFSPQKHFKQSAKKTLLHELEKSMHNCQAPQNFGCFLSGGIDSSSVLGILSKQKSKIPAFTIGFNVDEFDEQEYAKIAAQKFNAQHTINNLTPEILLELIPNMCANMHQPFGNSSIIPTLFCALSAKKTGVTHLFAGDGGDELFGGNQRYSTQAKFELYKKIPSIIRRNCLEPIKALPLNNLLLNKFRSYINQANIPLPNRLETYNLLHRLGINNLFTPEFLSLIDINSPMKLLQDAYFSTKGASSLNKILALDYKFTLCDNDLVKVRSACSAAGISVSFPLLQNNIIQFAHSLSDQDKASLMKLRPFYKYCMQGLLPDTILKKRKHGFGMPFGKWTLQNKALSNFVKIQFESFETRNILNAEYLQTILKNQLEKYPNYYGVIVWLVIILETWLQNLEQSPDSNLYNNLQRATISYADG